MLWIYLVLGAISIVGIIYIIRYYILINNIKHLNSQLSEIEQSPENNRILLVDSFQKDVERLCINMNNYIKTSQKIRIDRENREKKLRAQIENISHDLRTPLTSILGYIAYIDKEKMCDEDKESLDVVERKSRSLQRLINNFYDLSRLEMDDYNLTMEKIDIVRVAREIMLSSYQQLEDSKLNIVLDIGEKPIYVNADNNALERIFHNMIVNATRYAESYFKVSIEEKNDTIIVCFENDTHTLKDDDVPHLFERFYVKDKSRTKQGTGLGLTISRLLVEAMGGQAQAELKDSVLELRFMLKIGI